jgi:branched-chain amino acid transport system substrate-binding protein
MTVKSTRRTFLKGTASAATFAAAGSAPMMFPSRAEAFVNDPTNKSEVTLGFNVPQTGPYADEGADELRAYQLAVEHLNGEGDGGMLNTFSVEALKGNGILGKKVAYVTGDTQTKSDAARASARA